MKKLSIILIYYYTVKIALAAVPFEPRFITPNEFYHDGRTCKELLHPVSVTCPDYGLQSKLYINDQEYVLSQKEIEDGCTELNFASCPEGTNLFPDGVCRSCPPDYIVAGDGTGDLWCQGLTLNITYENPFNCNGKGQLSRISQNSYRICQWPVGFEEVTIDHYSKRDDFNNELTMAACVEQLRRNESQIINPEAINIGINSLNMIITEHSEISHGYIICPIQDEPFSFTASGYLLWYAIYILGFIINFIHFFQKKFLEKKILQLKQEDSERIQREGTIIEALEMKIADVHHINQLGLKTNFFSTIAWIMFWFMSWCWYIVILILIFDIYGFWRDILCPAEISERCAGASYAWREGIACSSGCLFSHRPTLGRSPYWPFEDNPGSMDQMFAHMAFLFAFTLLWWSLLIIFYDSILRFFYIKCDVLQATYILCIKKRSSDIRIETDKNDKAIRFTMFIESLVHKYIRSPVDTDICKIHTDVTGEKYIHFQCIKYSLENYQNEFKVKSLNIAKTKSDIHKLGTEGLNGSEVFARIKLIGENNIKYDVPNWFYAIWEELFTLFSLLQYTFLLVWYFNYYWVVGLSSNLVISISSAIRIVVKRTSQKVMKKISETHTETFAKRDGKWVKVPSRNLVPGDVIQVRPGDTIPADCVLVGGRVVMNESSLTGEPTPVPKLNLPNIDELYGHSAEDMKYSLLSGTSVESISKSSEGFALAIVLQTGVNTKKGELLWTMLFPPRIRFKFNDHIVIVYCLFLVYCILNFIIVGYLMHWVPMTIFYIVSFLSQALSPLIPAVFAAGQARCSHELRKKKIYCLEMSRTFMAAKVKTFCFDKTGTLTKQGMNFNGFSYYQGGKKSMHFETDYSEMNEMIRVLMGCCHELEFVNSSDGNFKVIGNEVDTAMFEESRCAYMEENSDTSTTLIHDTITSTKYRILKRFEFSRENMMMSVIVENQNTGKLFSISKGSYEKLISNCNDCTQDDFSNYVTNYSMKGHYIISLGYKELSNKCDPFIINREEIESELKFIGLLHFKNDLKHDTPEVIEHIKSGDIRCVMITGDNIYTACNIARESKLSTAKKILIGDEYKSEITWTDVDTLKIVNVMDELNNYKVGDVDLAVTYKAFLQLSATPASVYYPSKHQNQDYESSQDDLDAMRYLLKYTRIFARMKPDHKVEAVKLNMESTITGMVGDGANDAAASRMAHVGIAVSSGGGHATIVAPFSSSRESLSVVIDVIRYGRGTLATAFAGFKRLIVYGLMHSVLRWFIYHLTIQFSDLTWLFYDGILNVLLAVGMLSSSPAKRLTPYRPTSSLFGPEVTISILYQVFVAFVGMVVAYIILFNQDFFACKMFDSSLADLSKWWTMGDNYEGAMTSLLVIFSAINSAFAFNIGFDYRKIWFKNYSLMVIIIVFTSIMLVVIITEANFIPCIFRINCGDHYLLERWAEKDIISYSPNPAVPIGCPCSTQLVDSELCDQPYTDCNEFQYNSPFHNTIFPVHFRIILCLIWLSMLVFSVIGEWAVIFGPVRRYIRKAKKTKASKLSLKIVN